MSRLFEELSRLDPQKFTVEDVARVMGVWRWTARMIMNTGVRRGEFTLKDGFYSHVRKEVA